MWEDRRAIQAMPKVFAELLLRGGVPRVRRCQRTPKRAIADLKFMATVIAVRTWGKPSGHARRGHD